MGLLWRWPATPSQSRPDAHGAPAVPDHGTGSSADDRTCATAELADDQSVSEMAVTTAEAEREKRAKIINAEGESLAAAALGEASDIMMAHPLALQLRNLQSLVEIAVDKNSTVVFPAPLMSTISELGTFLAREAAASTKVIADVTPIRVTEAQRSSEPA